MLTPGSGSTPPTVNFRLSFGLCTAPTGSPADPECTISTPLHVPLSLSLPDIGGLVSVTGTGGVDISTKAVVKVGFGIHLPTVSPALGSGDPIVSGSPELFVDTDPANTALNVDLHAQTDENTSLQASVGPITMTLGKTYTAESGADCDNATDDNGNGAINDGCPQVGATAETALCGPMRQRDRRRRRRTPTARSTTAARSSTSRSSPRSVPSSTSRTTAAKS